MLFNSIEFAIFLPIVFLLYWFVFQHNLKLQNFFILVVSYIFYGWWNWLFLILIAFTSLCSFLCGSWIGKVRANHKKAKIISVSNIILNLSILGVFKYYNFFATEFSDAFLNGGGGYVLLNLILPVGISFYTFQALSYTIDVYKQKLEPTHDLIAFFAYISFFPQLVAGPIERATNLLPQFTRSRTFTPPHAVDGLRQILWGLFKKMVVADNCALLVNSVFENSADYSGSTLLLGAILFAVQIYCDFSGYSDIAIGSARLFGFSLMRNFNFPYFSRDIAEFWRRWHISLTTWFRDYVYIPLGGSRGSKYQNVRNTLIIFLASGLWHGANWTFIIWGAFNALLFLPLILSGQNRRYTNSVAQGRMFPTLKEFVQMTSTLFLVVIGWIIFRADSITEAVDYLEGVFSTSLFSIPSYINSPIATVKALFFIIVMFVVEWMQRDKQYALQIDNLIPYRWMRYSLYFVMIMTIMCFKGEQAQFIYFQF